MNFLQLCQRTVRESGTISGDATPPAVTGQSGRLLKVVTWTAEAWNEIQNLHDDWLWMQGEYSGATIPGNARYTGASWNIPRFGRFLTPTESVTIATGAGVADECPLRLIEYELWRREFGRGTQIPNRPTCYAISPAGELVLGPIPNAIYTVRGLFQKIAQSLEANADIPELPDASLHTVIVWKALLLLSQFDEGQWPTGVAQIRAMDDLRAMMKYRPAIKIGVQATIA